MAEQIPQLLIRELVLDVEVDGHQHAFQRGVVLFNGFGGFVQLRANIVFQVFDGTPASDRRDVESFIVLVFIIGQLTRLGLAFAFAEVIRNHRFLGFLEGIRQALQEHHAEDVILVLGCIHIAAQDIGGFP